MGGIVIPEGGISEFRIFKFYTVCRVAKVHSLYTIINSEFLTPLDYVCSDLLKYEMP